MASREQLIKAAQRAKAAAASMREKAEESVGEVLELSITAGTATAFGYCRGYFGDQKTGRWTWGDVDIDLAYGVTVHGLAFFGAFGKYDMYAHDSANGALSCYGANKGFEWGKTAREKPKTTKGVRGLPEPTRTAAESVAHRSSSAFAQAA